MTEKTTKGKAASKKKAVATKESQAEDAPLMDEQPLQDETTETKDETPPTNDNDTEEAASSDENDEEVDEEEQSSDFIVPGVVSEVRPGGGKAAAMKAKLAAQPKVAVMIPLSMGEKVGSTESVILNGYRLNIKKGVYVHVPRQVAQVLMESQQMTQEAISNYFLMNEFGVSQAMRDKGINNA